MSIAFVCIMGVATVFVGLIALIFITTVMSAACKRFEKEELTPASIAPTASAALPSASVANKQEIIAASCAVIAEELGTDVKNIKVVSFKKL